MVPRPKTFTKFHIEFGGPFLSGEDGIVLIHAAQYSRWAGQALNVEHFNARISPNQKQSRP